MSILKPDWVGRWGFGIDRNALTVIAHRHPEVDHMGDLANFGKLSLRRLSEVSMQKW